jgi:ABC-type nitrate/sulfonate/bicarbonate transport system permease component
MTAPDPQAQPPYETPPLRFGERLSDWLQRRPNVVGFVAVVVFLLLWEWGGRYANPLFLAPPSAIFQAAVELIRSGDLLEATRSSMLSFVSGMAIAIVGGILIGFLMGQFWFIEYALDPFVDALNAIPRIALIPIIILWFGLDLAGKVVIVSSIAILPIIINTYAGVKDVRGSLIEIGHAYCATQPQMFFKIILPAALPFIMSGIRTSIGFGLTGMVVAEFFTAVTGLGGLIVLFGNRFATAKLFVPVILIGIMGIALTQAVLYLERRLAPWRVSERARR